MTPNRPQDFPARYEKKLAPGETVLWWSPGSGRTFNATVIVLSAMSVMLISIFGSIALRTGLDLSSIEDLAAAVAIMLIFSLPAIGALHIYLNGASQEIYALTCKRVVAFQKWFPRIGRSVLSEADHHWRPPIKRIVVTGTASIGSVRLRGLEGNDHSFSSPFIIIGVSNPARVAELIKSTLQLTQSVEDRTTS